jgi:two-component system, chemotaxis family, CheB/CheR fusion protein
MPKSGDLFPIVGIGASAGGLEAFEQFFSHVPENCGMAFVVIQHLDPNHKGMLPELLQRVSKLEVIQVKDHMKVQPNHAYVIPPNKTMSISNGVLRLFPPKELRGLRLPIDCFFLSLAEDQGEHGVGIILSGMGSDGTIGLQAIKEKNGVAMAQEPSSAKFDSMPRHAIQSVDLDAVAPAKELAEKLFGLFKNVLDGSKAFPLERKEKSSLEEILQLLKMQTGNDFALYKKSTLYRRIERRIGVQKIDKIATYVQFLKKNPKELDLLFKELLIGVTSFFRDKDIWEKLENSIFPATLNRTSGGTVLRAWVPGCSTGEEAYSLAIVFLEALRKAKHAKNISLKIFASDLDSDAVEMARKGVFPRSIANDVKSEHLDRYFVKTEDGYGVITEIREMVVFAHHNLIMHPPFINIDIISCRNLLIYMDAELQHKIIGLFFYSLNANGLLILGCSESLGSLNHLFVPLDNKLKIYERSAKEVEPPFRNFPSAFRSLKTNTLDAIGKFRPGGNVQTLADQLLLQDFAPAGVLVNDEGDILYISGRTGKYLEPAAGKANLNIYAMLREGLRNEFPYAFMKALKGKSNVVLRNLKFELDGRTNLANINIHYIGQPDILKGSVMVVFTDVQEVQKRTPPAKKTKGNGTGTGANTREAELEKELQNAKEETQSTLEEMQTTQEELKTTNEELQSANEELQSANEELTSSKEEMQSLNEELQTLNSELQAKVDEFIRVDNDMKNLLNSTDIATLFLDKELNIRRYTDQATNIFKFKKSDVGRKFTDQVSDLDYPDMASDANQVLQTLMFVEKQVSGKNGRWFSVRIMPYRTYDDRIDGLVITFFETTELKQAEEKLKLLSNE